MFSDLVGSTALSARIDPEDLREVQHFGGFVVKYMGDGVPVYFESQRDNVGCDC
jgi:class 3 adenylate cyclase